MNYEDFLHTVESGMRERLADDISVSIHTTIKNNGTKKQGITIEKKDVNISPTIYMEEFYGQYKDGRSLEEILCKIDHFYHEVRYEKSVDVEAVQNYDYLKNKIMFKLINKKRNREMLEDIPYVDYQDLALAFYVLLDMKKGKSATITVSNSLMKNWGITCAELYEIAQLNGRRLMPAELKPMKDVIGELMFPFTYEDYDVNEISQEATDDMYVLSNEIRSMGAAVIAYDHVLEMVAEELNGSFYIIPSSIHEVVIVKEYKEIDRRALDDTIQEVNDTQVQPDEILSDHSYYYDRVSKTLYF